ncbi:transcription regulator [Apilactobacillus ozensis DSM 23829 = JCM 17196]|uniref:Transcription regulator n=1 Tax=Apilactobacillus ozensis DSM 23829 = JCM 17196 TaxID=1423781 RepID=A0A0R2AJT9_9LACO|nr:Rrf2 family transcriptional regulator [Apilactobacillus ozensis]KRM67518.1 transcription regulator [Apilactobacillus ozensis DSM 23829 = JCM 17196]
MRVSTKFSDSIHLLAFIEVYKDIKITSSVIAISINTSPVVVRRLIIKLRKANIIVNDENKQPSINGEPKNISLFDVFMATEGYADLFKIDKDTNPLCIVGRNIQDILKKYYTEAQNAAYSKLNSLNMQDVIDNMLINDKIKKQTKNSSEFK